MWVCISEMVKGEGRNECVVYLDCVHWEALVMNGWGNCMDSKHGHISYMKNKISELRYDALTVRYMRNIKDPNAQTKQTEISGPCSIYTAVISCVICCQYVL